MSRAPHFTPEEEDRIVRLYASGLSQQQVAREVGRSQPGVSKVIRRRREANMRKEAAR